MLARELLTMLSRLPHDAVVLVDDGEQLKEITEKYCNDCKFINNPKEGYKYILSNTKADETVLICGSFYMMSDIFGN